jgi:hypothetical protein
VLKDEQIIFIQKFIGCLYHIESDQRKLFYRTILQRMKHRSLHPLASASIVIMEYEVNTQLLFLVNAGFSNIYNLSGGIDAWSVDYDTTVLRY